MNNNKELCLKFSSEKQALDVLTRKDLVGDKILAIPLYRNIDVLGKAKNSDDFLVNVYLQADESYAMIRQYEIQPKTKNRVAFFGVKSNVDQSQEHLQE